MLLQYLAGFARLGLGVGFIDWSPEGGSEGRHGGSRVISAALPRLASAAEVAILRGNETLPGWSTQRAQGLEDPLLVNVMGFLPHGGTGQRSRTVFLDIDPGFPQMWKELGLADVFEGHDAFVTIGENIGTQGCEIPTSGLEWITTKQPVVLDEWPVQVGPGEAWTSVASWRGAYGPVDFNGKRYGLRVHEFRKFVELPRITGRRFRLALDIHPDETNDLALLEKNGWELLDPKEAAGDPWSYRSFIQASRAEFGVAKNMYVETRGGWFSDRSICYLASGRPVLVQDTGIRDLYPTGEGLLTYSTLEEAAAGVEEIERDYARHSRAAREIAEVFFDSTKVLSRLLERLRLAGLGR
ncbi:MAG: glycosyltransferase family protein [Actinomycetota bacterium]